jgi:Stigma-specific protein, Stig1
MLMPSFYASNSLYRSHHTYATVFESANRVSREMGSFGQMPLGPLGPFEPPIRPLPFNPYEPVTPLIPVGYHCDQAELDECRATAAFEHARCQLRIGMDWNGNAPWICQYELEEQLDDCRRLHGCPASYQCTQDLKQTAVGYCWPTGKEACDGICVEPCRSLLHRRDVNTCSCECGVHCRPPLVTDENTCLCKCPSTCPTGFLQNPRTCECRCPAGLTPCNDKCVDLQVDRKNCGRCGSDCGPQEECCFGNCVPLNRDPNCGTCSNDCSGKGQTCCAPNGASRGVCTTLGTSTNCAGCGNTCHGNERCCNGACTPLNTITNCGACGTVCRLGEDCCNGICTPLNTTANCGRCGSPCVPSRQCNVDGGDCHDVPLTCQAGKCVCPAGWLDCTTLGMTTHCCPAIAPVCGTFVLNNSHRTGCCQTGTALMLNESGTDPVCCFPERVLNKNGTKFCCSAGKVPSIGGDTLNPVCCSTTEVLADGQPRLVTWGGSPICRYL